jgi:DNA-binding CsgD family transcriptional regulator
MNLTSREVTLLSDIFTILAQPFTEESIRMALGHRMLELLCADHLGFYVWDYNKKQFVGRVAISMSDGNLSRREEYFRYRDTATPRLQQYRQAVRISDAIGPRELRNTDLFDGLLLHDRLYWSINVYAWAGDENIGDLRIWRSRDSENFSDHALQLAELIRPAFTAALMRARAEACRVDEAKAASASFAALAHLTARERQVVSHVCSGMPDKDIARELGISFATVRTHLDRAFQKLGVDNRVKLARLVGG